MWTSENHGRYDRSRLRYPSDLTDEERALVEPFIAKRGGAKRTVDVGQVIHGLMDILSTGCQWRAIPKDLPSCSTLYDYFDLWSWDGTLDLLAPASFYGEISNFGSGDTIEGKGTWDFSAISHRSRAVSLRTVG